MTRTSIAGLADVQAVYSGPEMHLWELLMGEQIHIGGLESSLDLAERAEIQRGSSGVDLCCCTGAGMRFLVQFREVAQMRGVDATAEVIQLGRERTERAGMSDAISFVLADACETGLSEDIVDFAWGEDAWCYVENKEALLREASRLVKPGGIIAFTDWMELDGNLSDEERERFCAFMKFPEIWRLTDYTRALNDVGARVDEARDTGRFAFCLEMYINYLARQARYDALKVLGWNQEILAEIAGEMQFALGLAKAGKIGQGLIIAQNG